MGTPVLDSWQTENLLNVFRDETVILTFHVEWYVVILFNSQYFITKSVLLLRNFLQE